ncbi:TrmB family transcriptional regulator [Halovivax limisalsi]|uniref:TrmB family transcriptional regulator n=1 Tax=Halovivax limisalsi TaxID=1453760 RepID=UPI001FFD49D8|nr:helix-turn-helix domain-containing protein [Halovivax limisalsi]
MTRSDSNALLAELGLKEYEATALDHLLRHGRTTAPTIADATGIPKARVYDVLDSLANSGLIKVIPGRPKEYQPKHPETILDREIENRRQAYETARQELESLRDEFLETFEPAFESASSSVSPTEELFHVVDVGNPSEAETRSLYHDADEAVYVLTKSFEYLDDVAPALESALESGVSVSVIFLHPRHLSESNRAIQAEIVDRFAAAYPEISYRFSERRLPWRGTFADPSMTYESGRAVMLVEDEEVPLHQRQAAITENGAFIAGLLRHFELIWDYDSVEPPVERD